MTNDKRNAPGDRPDASAAASAEDRASRQSAQSGRYTNFPAAAPDSNVSPPGAPQSSHGSATEPVPGGTEGAARAGQGMQAGMGATAAGGAPGMRQGGDALTPDESAATADRGTSRRDG